MSFKPAFIILLTSENQEGLDQDNQCCNNFKGLSLCLRFMFGVVRSSRVFEHRIIF